MIKEFCMFAGFGGSVFALKKAGIPHELVGFSEIDKYAIQCFVQNHGSKNYGNCRDINPNDLLDFDLLTGGFPCQAFSNAGKQLGELDTRGTLFYEIIRIAEVKKPKYMLLENVKGLTAKKFKCTFDKILSELDRIGYNVYWKVLNSKDYGIPQSRARIWFVCIRKDIDKGTFKFPEQEELKIRLKDLLEENVDEKYYLSEKMVQGIMKSHYMERKPQDMNGICDTLKVGGDTKCINIKTRDVGEAIDIAQDMANKEDKPVQIDLMHLQHGEIRPLTTYIPQDLDVHRCLQAGEPKEVLIEPNEIYPCLNPNDLRKGFSWQNRQTMLKSNMIRKLTPKECFRLQGFLNDEINLEGLSDTQCYKLAGNGWEINLASKILKEMLKDE